VRFASTADGIAEGISEIAVETPGELPGGSASVTIGGVRIRRVVQAPNG